jgi:hypothetical protein
VSASDASTWRWAAALVRREARRSRLLQADAGSPLPPSGRACWRAILARRRTRWVALALPAARASTCHAAAKEPPRRAARRGLPGARLTGRLGRIKGPGSSPRSTGYGGVYEGTSFRTGPLRRLPRTRGLPWPRLARRSSRLDDVHASASQARPTGSTAPASLRELADRARPAPAQRPRGRVRRPQPRLLSAFRSRTGRNQPSNSRFVFGPATWVGA